MGKYEKRASNFAIQVFLVHKKCQVKVLILLKNAFIFSYVYHCNLLFVSCLAKMAKNKGIYDLSSCNFLTVQFFVHKL